MKSSFELRLFEEGEKYRHNQTSESSEMVPVKSLTLEKQDREKGENGKSYHLLDYLQLKKGERASVACEAQTVRRHLEAVFEKGHPPRKEYYTYQRPGRYHLHLLQFEMAIPCECHKDVRNDQQKNGI